MSNEFPLAVARGKPDPATVALADELLGQPGPFAQAAALRDSRPRGPVNRWRSSNPIPRQRSVRESAAENAAIRAAALDALRSFPDLWAESTVREAIKSSLGDTDPQARVAAIRLALAPKAKIADSVTSQGPGRSGPRASNRPPGADARRQ